MDKKILLWNTYQNNENFGVLQHKGAVNDLKWSRDSRHIFSCSSDLSVSIWDLDTGERIRRYRDHHEDIINCLDIVRRGIEMIVSGSDDGSIAVWDPREKEPVTVFSSDYPILAVAVDQMGSQVFSGGVDGEISVWDSRNSTLPLYKLAGHGDHLVTSLEVSPDDQQLLSNGSDNTVRTWDVRSFVAVSNDDGTLNHRRLKVYDGASHGIEQSLLRARWSPDGMRIAAGSSDRTVVIWETHSRRLLHKLPGHIGTVNSVCFSPIEPIIASASADRTIMLGEIPK